MPKRYSDPEKEYIKRRLKDEAAKCLAQYGIRRTTVDEIVRRVNIPKGTFYLFYQSKELLLFDVILEQHELIEQELYNAIRSVDIMSLNVDEFTEVLFSFYKKAGDIPVLKTLNADEIELLALKLPEDLLKKHLNHDNSMVERMFAALPVKSSADVEVFSSAFRALYFSTLHRDELGEKNFDDALRLLIRGLAMQLI